MVSTAGFRKAIQGYLAHARMTFTHERMTFSEDQVECHSLMSGIDVDFRRRVDFPTGTGVPRS